MNSANLAKIIRESEFAGRNPFRESQARDFLRKRLVREFHPTSKYWSLLNASNEILVGTRGCGKTILLRMLCYSAYRHTEKIVEHMKQSGHYYLGIYIPLRLPLLTEIADSGSALRREQFSFIFNCLSVNSFLNELEVLIKEKYCDPLEQLIKIRAILNISSKLWSIPITEYCTTLDDFRKIINELFLKIRADWSLLSQDRSLLRSNLLEPIIAIKDHINSILNINSENNTWVACIDEAEYLKADLQIAINTIVRSATQGISVKIATLPLHWVEFNTITPDVTVQRGGDDFHFTSLDYAYDSADFVTLTNRMVAVRLTETGVIPDELINFESAFDDFLGRDLDRDLIDVYKSKAGYAFSDKKLVDTVIHELGTRPKNVANKQAVLGQIKRYKPLVMLRELKKMSDKGNTKVAWLAGPAMARRLAGGNARRFLQLCHLYFEVNQKRSLNENAQHECALTFCDQFIDRAKSVNREGFLLHDFLFKLSCYLGREMHGSHLKDVGLGFTLSSRMLKEEKLMAAINSGIAYSYIFRDDGEIYDPVTTKSRLRLANAFAAKQWIPMRYGSGTKVSSPSSLMINNNPTIVLSPDQAGAVIDHLQLNLFGDKI